MLPRNRMNVGQHIRKLRLKRKLTQLTLAHRIGYTGEDAGSYICRVENGTQVPRLSTLSRIAEALGAPLQEFVK